MPSPWTLPELTIRTAKLLRDCGKSVISLARETPGFVFNRLQGALLAEAMQLVDKGIASAEKSERCVRDGLGFRWSVTGPFESMDLASQGGFLESSRKYLSAVKSLWPEAETWSADTTERIDQWLREQHGLEDHGEREPVATRC